MYAHTVWVSFCPIGVFSCVYLPKIALMVILRISIYMVDYKIVVKNTNKSLIHKSMYSVFFCFKIRAKCDSKITFVIFLLQLLTTADIKHSTIV